MLIFQIFLGELLTGHIWYVLYHVQTKVLMKISFCLPTHESDENKPQQWNLKIVVMLRKN